MSHIDEIIAEGRRLSEASGILPLSADRGFCGYDVAPVNLRYLHVDDAQLIAHSCNNFEALAAEVERLQERVKELESLEAGYVKVLREFTRGGHQ